MKRHYFFLFFLLLLSLTTYKLNSQNDILNSLIKPGFEANLTKSNLESSDLSSLYVKEHYTDKKTGIQYYFIGQKLNEIPVYNAQTTVAVPPNGLPVFVSSGFIKLNSFKVMGQRSALAEPNTILQSVANQLGIINPEVKVKESRIDFIKYEGGIVSATDIVMSPVYLQEDGSLRLAYMLDVDVIKDPAYYQILADAQTGEIIKKHNYTVSCQFDTHRSKGKHDHSDLCFSKDEDNQPMYLQSSNNNNRAETSRYRVYELPAEAPSFANATIVESPYDAIASPYGWHDQDGADGVDNTTLTGNNTFVLTDLNADYQSDTTIDGGQSLEFLANVDFNILPENSKAAAATNLFYMINKIHDFSYHYGFTEDAGNFQLDNYGNSGNANDFVIGLSQFGNGEGDFINNADFSTPSDGSNGQMRMFFWENSGFPFHILSPSNIEGNYDASTAEFGTPVSTTPLEADAIWALDANNTTTNFCGSAANEADMVGKIVLIDRGVCEFSTKVLNAQRAGAVGAVIVNFEDDLIGMASGTQGAQVNIQSLFITSVTGELIRTELKAGNPVRLKFQLPENDGPDLLDGSLDNGIIAHEYGHGISNRLTGGPSNSGCLGTQEQMGEGWSDFFSLVMTRKPGDIGSSARGVGTYAIGENTNGKGIRAFPYSTDMSKSPLTMENLPTVTVPHGVGEIWCNMIWDLFWAMIDKHGDDGLLYGGNGGNSMAIQLVMEGMRLQPCGPGFVDGRDAIIQADKLLYNGENECLIWDVFARRGVGFFASQGSANSVGDNTVDFTPNLFCQDKITINKAMNESVEAGGEIDITVKITNYKSVTAHNIKVSDVVPENTSYVPNSGGTESNNVVEFEVDSLASGNSLEFTYKVLVDNDYKSLLFYQETFNDEITDNSWLESVETGDNFFSYNPGVGSNNSGSYTLENQTGEFISTFEKATPLTVAGSEPFFVITHRYNTQSGFDGGNIRYSEDGNEFTSYKDEVIRGKYSGILNYSSFVIPNLQAFSGNSDGFVESFVDVKFQDTKSIFVKLFFGASDAGFEAGSAWDIDNFEMVDARFINSEACVIADNTDEICTVAPEKGTYVRHNNELSKKKNDQSSIESSIFPNPGDGQINVSWKNTSNDDTRIRIVDVSGRVISESMHKNNSLVNLTAIDITGLNPGVYMIQLSSSKGMTTHKYIKN